MGKKRRHPLMEQEWVPPKIPPELWDTRVDSPRFPLAFFLYQTDGDKIKWGAVAARGGRARQK